MKLPPFSAWRLVSRPKHTDTAKVPNYYISRCQLTNSALRVESSKGGACRLVSGRQSWTIGSFSQTRNNRTRRYTRHHLENIPTIKMHNCFLIAGQTLTNPLSDRLPPSKEADDSRPGSWTQDCVGVTTTVVTTTLVRSPDQAQGMHHTIK